MSYRVYLHISKGCAFERTETGSRSIAQSVCRAFPERNELDKKEVSQHLVYQYTALVIHRFDASAGTTDNRQARVEEFGWPERQEQVSRPPELDGGTRRNVYLDAVSIARARKPGKGNISEDIRIALSRVWLAIAE